jgi:LacI family transcriptional regulator
MGLRKVAVMIGPGPGWNSGVLRGISHYAVAHGPWEFNVESPGLSLDTVREWKVDGIIVPLRNEEHAKVFRDRGVPTVNCSGALRDPGVPTVRPDDVAVGRLGASHLLERGLKHFGYAGFPFIDFSEQRRRGFEEAIRKAGFNPRVYEADPAVKADWTWDVQENDLARWLKGLPHPVGIMASMDERAWHVAEACRRVGLKVPEEVAILGVDNDELRCEFTTPPLSSVAIPTERVGFEAAALLDRLMDGADPPTHPVLVQPQGVVLRRSTDVVAVEDAEVARAFRFIRENVGRPYSAADVAHEVGAPRRRLDDQFRQALGRTLEEEIVRARLHRVQRILADTDMELAAVVEATGFRTVARLREALRQETGLGPTEYRQKFRLR